MKVYQTNNEGFFTGATVADTDPLDEGNWLIPAGCVVVEPPVTGENEAAQWINGSWIVVSTLTPEAPAPEVLPPTKAEQEAKRAEAYRTESDPLFFMAQRGEATLAEWEAKVAEIKARYPYPTE